MIDDGYTFTHKDWHCRPLGDLGREIVQEHTASGEWDALDRFLWNSPHFTGDESTLQAEDKNELFRLMLETPVKEMQEQLAVQLELELTDPLLSRRTCSACKKWWFDPDTKLIAMNDDGPILRPSHVVVMCETNEGCPKGHHSKPIHFSKENSQAWKHYLEWSSVGLSEEAKSCPILRGNWRIINRLVNKHGIPGICHTIF